MPRPTDSAFHAFAKLLGQQTGCSWIALIPNANGTSFVADYRPPKHSNHDEAVVLAKFLQGQPQPWLLHRAERLPDAIQKAFPQHCESLRAFALPAGILALASDSRRDDWPDLGDWLALASLLLSEFKGEQRITELQKRLETEVPFLRDELRSERDLRMLTGDSPAMRTVRLAIQQVARTDSTVLILGETGTGKELVARAIHQISPRRERMLVRVNCATLAQSVIASELFGHEIGAFTGANRRRIGRFEIAHRGTLFLDEVAEISPDIQVMLLRVLQEKTIERVGGNEPLAVDVRLVAATHADLANVVCKGDFRADLFYRLNVFPIQVPPLRERRGDLPDLVQHFIHHFNRRMNRQMGGVAPESLRLLMDYPWPGNVRELENLIERAMIVAEGQVLHIDPAWLRLHSVTAPANPSSLRALERDSILEALRRSHGRVYGPRGAATLLGVKPTTLYGKMKKHGISRDGDSAE